MQITNKGLAKSMPGALIIILLTAASVNNQLQYTLLPFFRSSKYIPNMLAKDDLGQLRELAYPLSRIVEEINKYPQDTNFYFAPCFEDSQNTAVWWWYLYILSRYLCYPRRIFCLDQSLYNDDKGEYVRKYTGNRLRYSELEWLKDRDVKYIILFRNNVVSILPIDTQIIL